MPKEKGFETTLAAATMTLYKAEQLFELPDPYTQQDVKTAYRKIILEKHPDVRKDVDQETANREASEINAAHKLLSNRFKQNPNASFARSKAEKPSYYSAPSSYTTPRPQQQTQYRPTQTQTQTPPPQWDPWWQNMPPETEEIPVEEVTWEDLAEDYWREYGDYAFERRQAFKRTYSMDDMKRDTVSSVVGGATKGVARFMDGVFYDGSVPDKAIDEKLAAYEERKKKINWATGRLAVLGYFIFVAFAVFIGVIAFGDSSNAATYGFAMMAASCVYGLAVVNIFLPFITVLLRKIPYKKLDQEYAEIVSARGRLKS